MVKKENCKDCHDSSGLLCKRHHMEEVNKFVTDGIHVSYWIDDMARWLETKNDVDFNYLCRVLTGPRFESILLRNHLCAQPPKKEEPKVHVCSCTDGLHMPKKEEKVWVPSPEWLEIANSHKSKEERLKNAYKRLNIAYSLVQASQGYVGLGRYLQIRQEILDILEDPPKKEPEMATCPHCGVAVGPGTSNRLHRVCPVVWGHYTRLFSHG